MYIIVMASDLPFSLQNSQYKSDKSMDKAQQIFHINYSGTADPQIHKVVYIYDHFSLLSSIGLCVPAEMTEMHAFVYCIFSVTIFFISYSVCGDILSILS